jgi:uncharacterized MnhB-related membrane protein
MSDADTAEQVEGLGPAHGAKPVELEDPVVRRVFSVLLVVGFALLSAPPIASILIFWGTGYFYGLEPSWCRLLGRAFTVNHLSSDLGALGLQILPGIFVALCIRRGTKILTGTGRVNLVLLIVTILSSFVALFVIDADGSQTLKGGAHQLTRMVELTRGSLQAAFTYLCLLIGLEAPLSVGKTSK